MAYKQKGWRPFTKIVNPITGKPLKSNQKLDQKNKKVTTFLDEPASPDSDIKKTHESNVWLDIGGKQTEVAHTFSKGARTKKERGKDISYTPEGEKIVRKAKRGKKWRVVKRNHIGGARAARQVKRKLKRYTTIGDGKVSSVTEE